MEAFVLDKSRLVSDVIGYVAELKNTFQSTGNPINDDDTTLQKFCVKFETILRHDQKEKYSLLGYRKDYWNFIVECIPKDDGVKYVQAVPQMKTAQGKGRCFIRYALVQKTLADAVQRLMVNRNVLSSWYRQDAIFRNPSLSTALVNKLYDLNDVDFDLPCAGYDLDISWPAFSRRKIRDGSTSGRRNSASSMTSVNFRNERQDPLVDLATEIASLEEFFNTEFSEQNARKKDTFDSVSMSASSNVDTPPISELTLKISRIHQQALKWRSTVNSERATAAQELKRAQDDKQYAIRESELKTKQLMEKFSNLTKITAEESDNKCSELADKLSEAEKALLERDSELRQLRNEVKKSVIDSSTAQKSAIELEKQLVLSERKGSKLETEIESLRLKLQSKEELEIEFELKEKQLKERMIVLESKENEYKENISELQGHLRAKEVALQSIQESFEKLNGMVFGSFEELEADMKQRLVEKEQGLQNQTVENRKLELSVEELQQQIREKRTKLNETKSELEDLQMSYKEAQNLNEKTQEMLKERDGQLQEYEAVMKELWMVMIKEGATDSEDGGVVVTNKQALIERYRYLFEEVQSLLTETVNLSKMLQETEQRFREKEQELREKNTELESLQADNRQTCEEIDVLKAGRDDLEKEKAVLEEELRTASSSLDDLQSELLGATHLNTEKEKELNSLCAKIDELTELTRENEQQIFSFKSESQDQKKLNETLQLDLSKAHDRLNSYESECLDLKEKLNSLEEDLRAQTDEKVGLEDELNVAKQQLESANEGRIRAEHAQVKAQEELENLQCMMDQEVAALKFQLSSETIKYETEIKVLSEQSQESSRYKDRSLEQEETIADLETKLKEKSDEWQNEKRKYVNEIKHLRHEVQLLKNALDGNKQKITTIENDFLLTTKQLDEERARQKNMKRKITEVNEQKTKSEDELKQQMKDMENDMRELKTKIVSLTSMPPTRMATRNSRSKHATGSVPPAKRTRRKAATHSPSLNTTPDSSGTLLQVDRVNLPLDSDPVVDVIQDQTSSGTAQHGLPDGLLSAIVQQVTDEVTKRLSQACTSAAGLTQSSTPDSTQVSASGLRNLQEVHISSANMVSDAVTSLNGALQGANIQGAGPFSHGHMPNSGTSLSSASELAPIVLTLMESSLQKSSIPTYKRAWSLFQKFIHERFAHIEMSLPVSPPMLALFIAYLFDCSYAPSTVYTYVSAIGFSHKLAGHPDPSKAFFITQMLKGYHKLGSRLDSRLPITQPILHKLLESVASLSCSIYQQRLFRAMYSLAFYAFLRVGEMTITTVTPSICIQVHQLSKLVDQSGSVVALKLTFGDYKHSYNQRSFSVVIKRQPPYCPVELLLEYLAVRGNQSGPLFQLVDGSQVSRSLFTEKLAQAIKLCGLDPSRYKGHSFRIGAASHAADKGLSDAQIRSLGRWSSNAFSKYIRIPSMST